MRRQAREPRADEERASKNESHLPAKGDAGRVGGQRVTARACAD